ncbi:hypothetical protein, partial [Paraburkholderia bengalensis]|uniref:hypothetical protein n=1 Tax=Paraburkholderia bengalensis TaxID=2747562 RepID=UPI003014B761
KSLRSKDTIADASAEGEHTSEKPAQQTPPSRMPTQTASTQRQRPRRVATIPVARARAKNPTPTRASPQN